jgi:cellulose synthase/poly-beta-1,6-N-acetylglucosamine synthase-like glycosyltransferase
MPESLASRTLVIVPTYNEAAHVETLVVAILQAAPAITILFVDDNSQDGTQEKLPLMQHQYGNKVYLLSRFGKKCVAVRDEAAWSELVACGANRVVGTEQEIGLWNC